MSTAVYLRVLPQTVVACISLSDLGTTHTKNNASRMDSHVIRSFNTQIIF